MEYSIVVLKIKKEIGGCCQQLGGAGNGELLFIELQFCKMKRVLEMDGGDAPKNMNVLNGTEPYT